MTDQANTTVSDERLAELAQAFKTWVQSGRSGAPDLDRDVAAALTELSARRATADMTEAKALQNAVCQALLDAFPMADKLADNYAAVAVKTTLAALSPANR